MKSKILSLCLSVVLAFGIWLYVITVVSPESQDTFRDVPVQIQNAGLLDERGLVITDISNTEVTLRLFGKRTDLIQLNKDNIRVTADVSRIYEPGVHEISYSVFYPGSIPNGAIEIQSRSPDTIRVTVEQKATKKLDVKIQYAGTVPSEYLTDEVNVQLDTKAITVSGPKSVVDTIFSAKVTVDLTGRTESIAAPYAYTLCDVYGEPVTSKLVTGDVSSVFVSLPIKKFKEVPIRFDVIYDGGATLQNTKITADYTSIKISGYKNLIDSINEIRLDSVDLSMCENGDVLTRPVKLPDGITNETGIHEVKVTVEFSGLVTVPFEVTNIEEINVPGNMKVTFITQKLEVLLRGPQEILETIQPSDITAKVDFSGTGEGPSTMIAKIVLPEQYSTVGAVGTYSVMAEMTKA